MRVQVQQIPPEGLVHDELLSVEWAAAELEGDAVVLPPGVEVQVRLQPVGAEILVEGRVRARLGFPCDACLEQAEQPTELTFTLLAGNPRPQDLLEEGEVELEDEDLDYLPLVGQELELAPVIREQLLLAIPMVRRCREDCRGLCPRCGANLNQGDCGCPSAPVDPRWEKLQQIKL